MNRKSAVWGGLFIGSSLGGFIPGLWGSGLFSFASILWTAIGSIIGIWIGFKISE